MCFDAITSAWSQSLSMRYVTHAIHKDRQRIVDLKVHGSRILFNGPIRSAAPRLPVLMLSIYPEQQFALVAIRRGANGYITKDAEPAELVAAIRRTAAGGTDVSASVGPLLQDEIQGADHRPPHQRLSVREHQIMRMIVKGMAAKEIGEEMIISIKTVSTHRTHILEKLGLGSTAELVLYAVRCGLIH